MRAEDPDEIGPIDYLVIELPEGCWSLDDTVVVELADLARAGTVRVLDVLVLRKAMDSTLEVIEVDGLEALGLPDVSASGLLGPEDARHLAWALEPGTAAGVIVWEHRWTGRLLSAVRGTGGRPVAGGRIPVGEIAAAVESGRIAGDLPTGRVRGYRRGVVGSPVARTAETGDTEAAAALALSPVPGRTPAEVGR